MAKFFVMNPENGSGDFQFFCPGCKCNHSVWTTNHNGNNAVWSFNGNIDKPTVNPSILVRWTRTTDGVVDFICHSYIREGKIQFLNDCTHELKGQTVELSEIDSINS